MRACTKSHLPLYLILLIINLLSISCNKSAISNGNSLDTITVEIIKRADSTQFNKPDGSKCDIFIDVSLAFPSSCGNTEATTKLRRLYCKHILYAPDTISVEDAIKLFLANSLQQYYINNDNSIQENDIEETDIDTVKTYNLNTTINLYYNKNGIVTFCKVDIVKKNGQISSVTHRYYNFDIINSNYIELNNLFRDDVMTSLCQQLKFILMKDNKVSSVDELNNIGYFNIDNMNVSRNLYFDDNGINWIYLPNEIAVEALGEPHVSMSYKLLEPYMSDNSILKRLY